jgi:hypothetical protein
LQRPIKCQRCGTFCAPRHASLDYAQALLHAKDLTEVMRLHSE